jgi:hypothetical protein
MRRILGRRARLINPRERIPWGIIDASKFFCFGPDSGKKFAFRVLCFLNWVMSGLEELLDHLARSSRLDRAEAGKLVAEVLAFFDESPEAFVRRRHRALQAEGLSNSAIFSRIADELARFRFRAPAYTERQLRRIIYG